MSLIINGQVYSLAHLEPFQRRVEVPLRGGLKKKILVEFRFSCHCYSRGPSVGEDIPDGFIVADGSKHHPRNRIFDQRRYDLSFGLVACIDKLITNAGDVHRTRHENFFRVDTLEETAAGVVTPISYYIFMSAKKVAKPDQEKYILIFVESAYPDLPNVPSPNSERNEAFMAVLGKKWVEG